MNAERTGSDSAPYSLRDLCGDMLRLGTFGFGLGDLHGGRWRADPLVRG